MRCSCAHANERIHWMCVNLIESIDTVDWPMPFSIFEFDFAEQFSCCQMLSSCYFFSRNGKNYDGARTFTSFEVSLLWIGVSTTFHSHRSCWQPYQFKVISFTQNWIYSMCMLIVFWKRYSTCAHKSSNWRYINIYAKNNLYGASLMRPNFFQCANQQIYLFCSAPSLRTPKLWNEVCSIIDSLN